jgi:Skp family chaperone for outer membrane proteins
MKNRSRTSAGTKLGPGDLRNNVFSAPPGAGLLPAMVLFAAICSAVGPNHAAAAEPLPIALVNVDRILKTHKPLQEQLDPLKAEAKELDAKVQVRQAEIETVTDQLRRSQPASPDQQRLQLQLVKLQTDLQQFINTERQKLQKKEVAVYLAFFRQLDAEIDKHAKARSLKLVLRQYETSYDENQPLQDILKALNRTILYEEGLDITDEILKALGAPAGAAGVQR